MSVYVSLAKINHTHKSACIFLLLTNITDAASVAIPETAEDEYEVAHLDRATLGVIQIAGHEPHGDRGCIRIGSSFLCDV